MGRIFIVPRTKQICIIHMPTLHSTQHVLCIYKLGYRELSQCAFK